MSEASERSDEQNAPASRLQRGLKERGVDATIAFLERTAVTVVARDYECPAGRMDIIAWQGEDLIFVEVRTTRTSSKTMDVDQVSASKVKRLRAILRHWLAENEVSPREVRFDVITLLVIAEDRALLRHHANVHAILS
jgi:putative endonuclease